MKDATSDLSADHDDDVPDIDDVPDTDDVPDADDQKKSGFTGTNIPFTHPFENEGGGFTHYTDWNSDPHNGVNERISWNEGPNGITDIHHTDQNTNTHTNYDNLPDDVS